MRHLISLVLIALIALFTPNPARSQALAIEGLNELGKAGDHIRDFHLTQLEEARRLKQLVKFREKVNDIWRETTPARQKADERVKTAKTALEAKRQSLASYERQYGPPERWPPEHQPKAKELADLERAVVQLESARDAVARIDDDARQITGMLQKLDQAIFAKQFEWYKKKSEDLAQSVEHLRQTTSGLAATWQPSPAPPTRVKNDTADVLVWVNGVRIEPGKDARIVAPTNTWLQVTVQAQTPRRLFILDKGKNPTAHTTIAETTPYALVFDLDAGAGNTHTEWRSHDEVYTWVTSSPHWKVVPEVQVGASGQGPTGDALRFKVPFIAKDRFGRDGWQSYALCFHGEVKWTMTRTGKMSMAPKDESEPIRGGCVIIDVFSS